MKEFGKKNCQWISKLNLIKKKGLNKRIEGVIEIATLPKESLKAWGGEVEREKQVLLYSTKEKKLRQGGGIRGGLGRE